MSSAKGLLPFLFLILALAAAETAPAGTIAFSPLSATIVPPGGSIHFEIYGLSVNDIGAFSLFLNSSGTGSQFQLSSYALNTDLFQGFTPDPPLPEAISATRQSQDLGSFASDSATLGANTMYLLGTATVTVDSDTPAGTYTLSNSTQTVFTDPSFEMSDDAPASTLQITVAIVPEASTAALLTVGSAAYAIVGRKYRPTTAGRARGNQSPA
jgi:hypothetical protein